MLRVDGRLRSLARRRGTRLAPVRVRPAWVRRRAGRRGAQEEEAEAAERRPTIQLDEMAVVALQAAALADGKGRSFRALPPDFQTSLARLTDPRSQTPIADVRTAADALTAWRDGLRHGRLPGVASGTQNAWAASAARVGGTPDVVAGPAANWPREPFRGALLQALREVGMARFTRKHPDLADGLLRNILDVYTQYEAERRAEEEAFEPEPNTPRDGPSQGGANDAEGAGEPWSDRGESSCSLKPRPCSQKRRRVSARARALRTSA